MTTAGPAEALNKLRERKKLTAAQMGSFMRGVMDGRISDAEIEDALLILRERGETAEELSGAALVLRERSLKLPRTFPDLLDTCGTGGDGQHTLNVSTLSAIVACAAGARVAKHGNRSVSSVCGSADILELLGIRPDLSPASVARSLEKEGFGFLFAPLFHPAVKAAMPARKRIQGKTLFNILGPLSNPASAPFQLVGVYEKRLVRLVAEALMRLGSERALVVHGADGMDEMSLSGETFVAELSDGAIREYEVVPEDFGLKRESIASLRCETKEESLRAARNVLQNDATAASKIVCLNAAAALYVSGVASSVKEGLLRAMDALESGRAEKKCRSLSRLTRELA